MDYIEKYPVNRLELVRDSIFSTNLSAKRQNSYMGQPWVWNISTV